MTEMLIIDRLNVNVLIMHVHTNTAKYLILEFAGCMSQFCTVSDISLK